MRLLSIASGSSGNCIYVGNEDTHILVDTGISGKRIEAGLNTIGLFTNQIDGIFITHEHIDHIAGLGVLARRYQIPIYATKGTIEGICRTKSVGVIDESLYHVIEKNIALDIGCLTVNPMEISHDANDPVAYRIFCEGKKLGIITDLGLFTEEIVEGLQDMNALFVEANHDVNMLQVGPYPYPLKQRILGKRGHLSNENSGRLLSYLLHDKLSHIILGHLSKDNNMPELAFETVRLEIAMGDNPYTPDDFSISVARRSEPSPVIEI